MVTLAAALVFLPRGGNAFLALGSGGATGRPIGRKRKTGPRSWARAPSFAAGVFTLAFCAVAVRLFDVMVLGAIERYSQPVLSAEIDIVPHSRADILDRSGLLLATNLPTVNLYADAQKIIDAEDAARRLIRVLPHLSYQEVLSRLRSGRRFVYLERSLTPAQQHAVNVQGIPGSLLRTRSVVFIYRGRF